MSFEHKKSLGQHFLTSDVVPDWMCDAAYIQPGETVVEIGPGTGVLTKALLERGAQVLALEADLRAVTVLTERFAKEIAAGQLEVKHYDIRDWDPATFSLANQTFKVVANIPYYLSGLLFRSFLENKIQPNWLVFLVQKEVAKRATASREKGEKESLLSLSVKVFGEAKYVRTVSRGHFDPPPKVDSGIISVRNISRTRLAGADEILFFKLIHLGFAQKRKQLLGNLAGEYDRNLLTNTFSTLSLPLDVRAEDLTLAKWLELTKALADNSLST